MASSPPRRQRETSAQPEKRQTRFSALLVIAIIVMLCYAAFLTYIRHDNHAGSAPQNAPQPQSTVAPKYDFYPNHTAPPQAAVPSDPSAETPTPPPRPPIELLSTTRRSTAAAQAPTTANGGFVVQAGAFNRYRDAESRGAALLLIGIKSYIEAGQVGNTEVHRVRIGPFTKRSDAAKLRERLDGENIPAYVLSLK